MENAGAGAARIARELLGARRGPVVCVCGPGGNGGDGLVVARHLAVDAVPVRVVQLEPARAPDAVVQEAICRAMGLPSVSLLDALPGAALVVDGIYGTGLTRAPEGAAREAIDAITAAAVPVLALDLPSGLDCDTGEPLGACIRAGVTATFAAPKLGFSNPRSRAWTGEVRVVGIGAPVED
jgi:NAD(P)H-hydrate epimerase